MDIDTELLAEVDAKLNQQNALKAAIAVSLWSIPVLIAWYYLFHNYGRIAPMFLFLSGACVGLAVRYYGKGYTAVFSLLAVVAHFLIIVSAGLLELVLAEGEQIWAVFLLALYVGGAWIAGFLARIQIPFHEERAFFELTEMNKHESAQKWRNRWFVSLPVSFLGVAVLLWLTSSSLYVFDQVSTAHQKSVEIEQRRDSVENNAIDVTEASLRQLSDEEALLHAYAYYSGILLNKRKQGGISYPCSTYKSQTILKFLVSERELSRAKFILVF